MSNCSGMSLISLSLYNIVKLCVGKLQKEQCILATLAISRTIKKGQLTIS